MHFWCASGEATWMHGLQDGIEANPEKIAAIQNMKPPKQLRDVQKLIGCLAALSRFISRLGEKALPLYQLMKKITEFRLDGRSSNGFRRTQKATVTSASPGN